MKRISFWTLKYLQFHNMTWHPDLTERDFAHIPKHHRRTLLGYWGIPQTLDWRDNGLVGPVHDQGGCNSCWAFAAAGSLEYWLKKDEPEAEVDVQSILDCSPETYGCLGGLMEHAFDYPHYFPTGYRYKGKAGMCRDHEEGVRAISHVEVDVDVEHALPYMLHKWGPVPVAVDFAKLSDYKGHVLTPADCKDDPHHAVLLVGYTPEYWIVKNSMGTDWGDNGYAYVKRGYQVCGINTYASVATGIITT